MRRIIKRTAVQSAAFCCGFWWAVCERQKWKARTGALLCQRSLLLLGRDHYRGGKEVIELQTDFYRRQYQALERYFDRLGPRTADGDALMYDGFRVIRTGTAPAPCSVSRSGCHVWEEGPKGKRCAVCGDPRAPLCTPPDVGRCE